MIVAKVVWAAYCVLTPPLSFMFSGMDWLMCLFTVNNRQLRRLALPMILSNITVPLLGLVDTAVIGHLDSPVYLGGVVIAETITSFVFMLLLFLHMSTTGLPPRRSARAIRWCC